MGGSGGRIGRRIALALMAGAVGALGSGCTEQQLERGGEILAISDRQAQQLGDETWQRIRSERGLSDNREWQARVQTVARRVVAANDLGGQNWNVAVLQGDEVNAFALPGGHIAFYEGMMRLVENDDQIAAVMGHEIGHVTERHSAQRVGLAQGASVGVQAVSAALQAGNVGYANQIAGLLGAGMQYGVVLPYSRNQETDADAVGLRYMARAGYDPRQAVAFWQRMRQAGGQAPPEFLSTHPASARRIEALEQAMPEALDIYRRNR